MKILISCLIGLISVSAQSQGVQFEEGSWAQVVDKAKTENKVVFLDCFTTWCGPCKWMDKNVFPTAEAGDFFNTHFVNAEFDMEKGEGLELAKKYNVRAYPTFLFIDNKGEVVHKILGSMELKEFLVASGNALNPERQYANVMNVLSDGTPDAETLFNMTYVLQQAGDRRADSVAALYLKTEPDLSEVRNARLVFDFTYSAEDPNYTFLRDHKDVVAAAVGEEWYEEKMYRMAYQGAVEKVGLNESVTREACPALIASAREYFQKVYPESGDKLAGRFAMDAYSTAEDATNYAKAAIAYYDKYPSNNSGELNNVAWSFFETVDNPAYLKKALEWSLQSVQINAGYPNMDTVANLYFKLGDKDKAAQYANKAIALGRASGEDTSSTEELLTKIQM